MTNIEDSHTEESHPHGRNHNIVRSNINLEGKKRKHPEMEGDPVNPEVDQENMEIEVDEGALFFATIPSSPEDYHKLLFPLDIEEYSQARIAIMEVIQS